MFLNVTGADIPLLTSEILKDAFLKLEGADVVLGPASDGGYYLIGMKSIHEIFGGIPWSTEKVFTETVSAIGRLNLRMERTVTLSDVDTIDDLMKWKFE